MHTGSTGREEPLFTLQFRYNLSKKSYLLLYSEYTMKFGLFGQTVWVDDIYCGFANPDTTLKIEPMSRSDRVDKDMIFVKKIYRYPSLLLFF